MKINDILLEKLTTPDPDWINKNCSDAIKRYKTGNIIYRGMDNNTNDYILMTPNRNRRHAANAKSNLHNDIINKTAMFKSFPKREIIMTTSVYKAREYGGIHIALPVNGAVIGNTDDKDIFYSFTNIQNLDGSGEDANYSSLGLFYRYVLDEFTDYLSTYSISTTFIYDMQDARYVFKSINNMLSIEEKKELIESLRENPNFTDNFINVIYQCIKSGKATPLFKLFEPIGWGIQKISQFIAPENVECWTDSPTVLIPIENSSEFFGEDG